jgi:hypothetical protein
MIPLFPAHGALGGWDEVIFFAIVIIFIVMMGVSWLRGQSTVDEIDAHKDVSSESEDENRFELK